jgi:hypothetical protein
MLPILSDGRLEAASDVRVDAGKIGPVRDARVQAPALSK